MINDDPMYVRQLEAARDAAEIEIKALEDELKRCHEIMSEQQEPVAFVGEYYGIQRTGKGIDLPIGTRLYTAPPDQSAEVEAENARLRFALENCRLLAARYRKEDWALLILGFCAEAGIVGSVTR